MFDWIHHLSLSFLTMKTLRINLALNEAVSNAQVVCSRYGQNLKEEHFELSLHVPLLC